jgi:3-oxoacyl-[acyl-carrier protein] reductase
METVAGAVQPFDEAVESLPAEERPHLSLRGRGKPEAIASVVAVLCPERASFVTGASGRADAGSVAQV